MRGHAFEGDELIGKELQRLGKIHKFKAAVETGTQWGYTSCFLAGICPVVHTIEINNMRYAEATYLQHIPNLKRHLGSSPDVLKSILPDIPRPTLFYLDAHAAGKISPLLEELATIAKAGMADPVICIHDFQVPGTQLGFNKEDGTMLSWELVAPLVFEIYRGNNYKYHYNNDSAMGAKRGIIYIEPSVPGRT